MLWQDERPPRSEVHWRLFNKFADAIRQEHQRRALSESARPQRSPESHDLEIEIHHRKNPDLGWDIDVRVKARANSKLYRLEVTVNGLQTASQDFTPPVNTHKRTLVQQGLYPGDNVVHVNATDQNGQVFSAVDSWQ